MNNNTLSETIIIKRGPKGSNKTSYKKGVHYSPKTEFKKGHTPWNTGIKGLRMSQATEFKKGRLPWNTRHDGCIVTRNEKGIKYKWIRTSMSIWQPYHRYLWEKKYGLIPRDLLLIFKNGNTMDFRIKNFKLITRAENARRNINRKKAAETKKNTGLFRYFNSDEYVAYTLAPNDEELQKKILKKPVLIKAQRENLKLEKERIEKFTVVKPPNKIEAENLIVQAKENESSHKSIYSF